MKVIRAFENSVFWTWNRIDVRGATRKEKRVHASTSAHKLLRELGCRVLESPAARTTIRKDDNGRPSLHVDDKVYPVSITHSREIVAVALCVDPVLSVGLDVEFRDPKRNIERLSRWIYDGAPPAREPRDFYRDWCLFEAVFKATGNSNRVAQHEIPFEHQILDVAPDFAGVLVISAGRD